jgi:hypothetical protein
MGPSIQVCRVFHQKCDLRSLLDHTTTTTTLDHIIPTMIINTIVNFGIIVTFVISVIALLTSSPVMWREEHL